MRKIFLLQIMILVTFFSCKKEQEPVFPTISIDAPYEGQQFSAGDTITVHGSALCSEGIESITINLLDTDMIGVIPAITIRPSANSFVFNESLITNGSLVSGDYYIQVVASSKTEKSRKYVKVSLSASAGKTKSYLVFTEGSINTHLYSFDTGYVSALRKSFNGIYIQSDIFGNSDLLGISLEGDDLYAVSLSDFSVKWSLPRFSSTTGTFRGVRSYGGNLYVAHAEDGMVRAYDAGKIAKYTSYLASSYKPDDLFIFNGQLLIDEMPVVTSDGRRMTLSYVPSGAGIQQVNTGFDIVSFVERTSDEVYVFGNDGSQSFMKIYSVSSNGFYSIHPITGPVVQAIKINNDDLIIATYSQIYSYRYSTNSLIPYLPVSAKCVVYDGDRGELLVGTGNEVRIYDYNSKQIKKTVAFGATVLDIKLSVL